MHINIGFGLYKLVDSAAITVNVRCTYDKIC